VTAAFVTRWHDAAPRGWEELLELDPDASPAQRAGFVHAVAATCPGFEARFVTVEQGGARIGGAPLLIERRAGFHWLHALPWLLPGTPLARPGAHAEVDRAVADALAGVRCVGGEWVFHRPRGSAPEPSAIAYLPGETRWLETALVDLAAGAEAAARRLERHARQELALARRRGLEVREQADRLEEAYALHGRQARNWGGHRPPPLELLRRLLEGPDPLARLFTVSDRGGTLASVLVLVHRHEWFAWWSGTHPDARRHHGFALLLWEVAMRAAAAGADRFNLGSSAGLMGVEGFKRALGARIVPTPVRWIAPNRSGVLGRALGALQGRVRRGRDRGVDA
jgi:CelD/BcsL family acetyltransferase involved in cellulose biosynthesis